MRESRHGNTYTCKQTHLTCHLIYLSTCIPVYLTYFSFAALERPPNEPREFCGRIISTSVCGRGITCTDASSPTRLAAAAPASVAALTAPTSPRTITVTYPPPTYSLPISRTWAAFTMASAASMAPTNPLVSIRPNALTDIARPSIRPIPPCEHADGANGP